jgi:hypothetical protein
MHTECPYVQRTLCPSSCCLPGPSAHGTRAEEGLWSSDHDAHAVILRRRGVAHHCKRMCRIGVCECLPRPPVLPACLATDLARPYATVHLFGEIKRCICAVRKGSARCCTGLCTVRRLRWALVKRSVIFIYFGRRDVALVLARLQHSLVIQLLRICDTYDFPNPLTSLHFPRSSPRPRADATHPLEPSASVRAQNKMK